MVSDKEFTVGYLEQGPQLDPRKTVIDVVREGANGDGLAERVRGD